ncbi:MAG: DUF6155 family protein [Bacillota bacterium]
MSQIKLSDLKSYIHTLDEKTLKAEIAELFKIYPNVKEYFSLKINPANEVEILAKYKKIVENEFFPERGFGRLRYSVLKKAVSDFKKIAKNPKNVADLMISYAEKGIEFTNTYGDIDEKFYNNILNMYETALDYVNKKDLEDVFQTRLIKVLDEGKDIGWGFSECLDELYYTYFNVE